MYEWAAGHGEHQRSPATNSQGRPRHPSNRTEGANSNLGLNEQEVPMPVR